jgi:hypothetical protein
VVTWAVTDDGPPTTGAAMGAMWVGVGARVASGGGALKLSLSLSICLIYCLLQPQEY